MDWLPKPKVEAEGFENNILSFAETETKTAILNLNTASALQDLKLKFTFGDPQFSSLMIRTIFYLFRQIKRKWKMC